MGLRVLLAVFLLGGLVGACSQRVTPEEEYARQARDRPLLPASAAAPARAPAGMGAAAAEPGPASSADIAVTIESASVTAGSGAILFVFVRPAGVTMGPPLAAKRISGPSFPLTLSIGPGDAMIAGTEFPQRVVVQARLDEDGDATTEGPRDAVAASELVEPGGAVRIVLE